MRKIIYFYNIKARYYSSYPIVNNIKILFDYYEKFKTYKIEPIPFTHYLKSVKYEDYLTNEPNKELLDKRKGHEFPVQWELGYDKMLLLNEEGMMEMLNHINNNKSAYKKAIILAFHPVCNAILYRQRKIFEELKKELGLKLVLWQDDLHAYFKDGKRGEVLDNLDCILSPSPIFFKNVKSDLSKKTKFFFYSMDFDLLPDKKWEDREPKILLSGSCNRGYPIRHQILTNIKKKTEMSSICAYLKRTRFKEYNRPIGTYLPVGLNYYDKLVNFQAAFFAYYEHPKNFNLAKIIEILACGCLGFFEKSPLLEEEMGMKEFEHYIPITDENGKLIEDVKYYEKWLNNKEGRKIAENGKEFVKKNFSNNNGFINYVKILKKL